MDRMDSQLAGWLQRQLDYRGWTQSEAARRGGISSQMISSVMGGTAKPGLEFCRAIARAFGVSFEEVLRIAGILPPIASGQKDVKALLARLNEMDPDQRADSFVLINMILDFRDRAASAQTPAPRNGGRRRRTQEPIPTDDPGELRKQFRVLWDALPEGDRREIYQEIQALLAAQATDPSSDQ